MFLRDIISVAYVNFPLIHAINIIGEMKVTEQSKKQMNFPYKLVTGQPAGEYNAVTKGREQKEKIRERVCIQALPLLSKQLDGDNLRGEKDLAEIFQAILWWQSLSPFLQD